MEDILETYHYDVNLISEGTRIEGTLTFDRLTRINGEVEGSIHTLQNVTCIVGEKGYVKANIHADKLIVDGFVIGNITAKTMCQINETATVIGEINSPSIQIKTGAKFEGKAVTKDVQL